MVVADGATCPTDWSMLCDPAKRKGRRLIASQRSQGRRTETETETETEKAILFVIERDQRTSSPNASSRNEQSKQACSSWQHTAAVAAAEAAQWCAGVRILNEKCAMSSASPHGWPGLGGGLHETQRILFGGGLGRPGSAPPSPWSALEISSLSLSCVRLH